jgi:hypothetical protein
MSRGIDEEKEFSENIDRLLNGEEIKIDENISDDLKTAFQFAKKIKNLRDESSPVFKDQLKRRLLLTLAEKEAEAVKGREKRTSFWETLRNLMPQSTAWRTASATVVVSVLAIIVFWGPSILPQAPEQTFENGAVPAIAPQQKVIPEESAVAMLDSDAILNLEPVLEKTNIYVLGEKVNIGLVFRNTGSELITLSSFPPTIQIWHEDTNTLVRSFSQGSESAEISTSSLLDYTLVWDQLDDEGNQVESGRYSIFVSNINIQRGTERQEDQASFGPVIEIVIETP